MRSRIFMPSAANPLQKTKAEGMLIFAAKSRNFILLVLSVLILWKISTTHADHLAGRCAGAANYTRNSIFEINLKKLLSSISTDGPAKGLYNASAGDDPDRVYGLGLCWSDVDPSTCQLCLEPASQEVEEVCPNKKEVILWFQYCMIRFTDVPFFGTVDTGDRVLLWNTMNESNSDDWRINASDLLNGLVVKAAASPLLFATGSLTYPAGETKYGMVQCSRDLSADGCKECLGELMKDLEGCCRGKREWRILAGSCNIRFDGYNFYENTKSNGKGGGSGNGVKVIIAIVSALVVVAVLVASVFFVCRRKRRQKAKEKGNYGHAVSEEARLRTYKSSEKSLANIQGEDEGKAQELPLIDLDTIEIATDYFGDSSKLGEGGFGPVYKGVLADGKQIAVKRLSKSSVQGLEEFRNEISLIARLQHRNLVKLLYCCIEREERMLVYEFMPNTSLDVFLFNPDRRVELNWSRRHIIVMGIAKGLVYLHEDSRLRIIHRDLKASNVLLDEEMNPKISDFGLARIFAGNGSGYNTNRIVGTFGYMAPEYALEGLFSVKSDVFSFGVLLLEIISGQKNHSYHLSQHAESLLAHTWKSWSEGKGMDLIDPLLIGSCPTNEVLRWVHIGLLCVQEDPAERPTMSKAVLMLGSENVTLPKPTKPIFSVRRGAAAVSQSSSSSAQISSIGRLTITDMGPR